LTGYKKIDDVSAFGFDLRYFNMGDIELTDRSFRTGPLGEFTPRDIAIGGTYSRKLSDNLGSRNFCQIYTLQSFWQYFLSWR
jgi:hypothetical protein